MRDIQTEHGTIKLCQARFNTMEVAEQFVQACPAESHTWWEPLMTKTYPKVGYIVWWIDSYNFH